MVTIYDRILDNHVSTLLLISNAPFEAIILQKWHSSRSFMASLLLANVLSTMYDFYDYLRGTYSNQIGKYVDNLQTYEYNNKNEILSFLLFFFVQRAGGNL